MRLLVDMNLTPRWVRFLSDGGHSAAHWSTVGAANAEDREICEYARSNGFTILSTDLDFPQILAHTRNSKPSIILMRGEPLVPEVRGSAVLLAIKNLEAELEAGAILSLDWSGRARFRLLPL